MQKVVAFLKLIRYKNLLIVALTQFLIRFSLTETFLPFPALTKSHFLLFVITTVLITASGYIINDIYDVKTDRINKKRNTIIGVYLKERNAMNWYFILNGLAFILGIFLAIDIGKPLYSLIFLYCIFILWHYSKNMKKVFLIGNIHVAILTALVLINTALFDIIPHIHYPGNESGMMIIKIILIYALFSFLLTLIREFVKDLEDIEGDYAENSTTLAIVLGKRKTKFLSSVLIFFVIIIIAFWQYFQYQILSLKSFSWNGEIYESVLIWGTDKYSTIYTTFLQFSLLLFMLRLFYAKTKTDFYYLSQFNKVIMLLGICSIPIFTYFYLK
tara:strand:+ start:62 stop:1048 length:987 start_codon:yes stop_codon:yes gene_type:complete